MHSERMGRGKRIGHMLGLAVMGMMMTLAPTAARASEAIELPKFDKLPMMWTLDLDSLRLRDSGLGLWG